MDESDELIPGGSVTDLEAFRKLREALGAVPEDPLDLGGAIESLHESTQAIADLLQTLDQRQHERDGQLITNLHTFVAGVSQGFTLQLNAVSQNLGERIKVLADRVDALERKPE